MKPMPRPTLATVAIEIVSANATGSPSAASSAANTVTPRMSDSALS